MSMLARMDALVTRLGLYPGLAAPPRPRHARWLPLVLLSLAAAGMVLHVRDVRFGFLTGFNLILLAFVFSTLLTLFSPLRVPTPDEPLDERERALRSRSYLFGAMTVTVLCLTGALAFSLSEIFLIWTPRSAEDWRAILFLLFVVFNNVPPLHASWTTRPIGDDS